MSPNTSAGQIPQMTNVPDNPVIANASISFSLIRYILAAACRALGFLDYSGFLNDKKTLCCMSQGSPDKQNQ